MKSGIYKITNKINNKFYIGSSSNLDRRKKDHFRLLRTNKNSCTALQNAVNKYGIENFEFEILVRCESNILFTIEQKLVDELKPDYNISILNVAVPQGLPYKNKNLYKIYAKNRLLLNNNFGWKSRIIQKLDCNNNVIKEYPSLKSYAEEHNCAIGTVGKALKKGNKCKGFKIQYKV